MIFIRGSTKCTKEQRYRINFYKKKFYKKGEPISVSTNLNK